MEVLYERCCGLDVSIGAIKGLLTLSEAGPPSPVVPPPLSQRQQASASALASRRSVLTFRVRVAYIGAKFGSAATTSWPKVSRHRATHSLSVEASSRIRARAAASSGCRTHGGRQRRAPALCVRMSETVSTPEIIDEGETG
jgi:hypothetical protein